MLNRPNDHGAGKPAQSKVIGIMQPYFFPYFEQFRLIAACDVWVVFDTAQYTKKSWMSRNRILNRDKGTSYLSVPVQHTGRNTPIAQALIDTRKDWRADILNKLRVYEAEAPEYATVRELVAESIAGDHRTIASLNTALLRRVCSYLQIDTPVLVTSTLLIDLPTHCEPGEWALHISKYLGATEYRNAAGGKALFDPALYASHGIKLSFHEAKPRTYPTGRFNFVPDMSVIDWMMWNKRETLKSWLL